MNKRAIVNVATGEFYCKMQRRLWKSLRESVDFMRSSVDGFEKHDLMRGGIKGIDLLLWSGELPTGSRPHTDSPYGFKVHAIKAAYEMGYTSVLWLDSPAHAIKEDISPIFEKIEKEGYYAMSHIDPLENWVGDTALSAYGYDREILKGLNLPSGSCYGFRIDGPMPTNWPLCDTPELFWDLYLQEADGLFQSEKIGEGKWHRHDEAMLALNLLKRGLPVFAFDPLFQSDSSECVIRSGGEIINNNPLKVGRYHDQN
jgi:hypothetical protein